MILKGFWAISSQISHSATGHGLQLRLFLLALPAGNDASSSSMTNLLKTYSKWMSQLFFGTKKIYLWILIQCPYRHLICVQNFVLHIFELHMFGWFYVRICSTLGSVDPIFHVSKKRGEKVLFQMFRWIETVWKDPHTNSKLSRDRFEYSYIL